MTAARLPSDVDGSIAAVNPDRRFRRIRLGGGRDLFGEAENIGGEGYGAPEQLLPRVWQKRLRRAKGHGD